MPNVTLIGIVLGQYTSHVHCQDEKGHALLRIKFSRFLQGGDSGDGVLRWGALHGSSAR